MMRAASLINVVREAAQLCLDGVSQSRPDVIDWCYWFASSCNVAGASAAQTWLPPLGGHRSPRTADWPVLGKLRGGPDGVNQEIVDRRLQPNTDGAMWSDVEPIVDLHTLDPRADNVRGYDIVQGTGSCIRGIVGRPFSGIDVRVRLFEQSGGAASQLVGRHVHIASNYPGAASGLCQCNGRRQQSTVARCHPFLREQVDGHEYDARGRTDLHPCCCHPTSNLCK